MLTSSDYFAVFEMPMDMACDLPLLESRYIMLQKRHHPDHARSPELKEAAMADSSFINEAYQTLRSPRRRMCYLLHLCDRDIESDQARVKPSPDSLMQAMEWQETLEALEGEEAIEHWIKAHQPIRDSYYTAFGDAYRQGRYDGAAQIAFFAIYLDNVLRKAQQLRREVPHASA